MPKMIGATAFVICLVLTPSAIAALDAVTIGNVGGIGGLIQSEWEEVGDLNTLLLFGCSDAPRWFDVRVLLRDPTPVDVVDAYGLNEVVRLNFESPTAVLKVSARNSCSFSLWVHGTNVAAEVIYEVTEPCVEPISTNPCIGAVTTGCPEADRLGLYGPEHLNGVC